MRMLQRRQAVLPTHVSTHGRHKEGERSKDKSVKDTEIYLP